MDGIFDLSRKIKKARVLANLSQKGLASKLGVSDKTISAYEQSRAIPPIPTLHKIAQITNKPIEYFFEPDSWGIERKIEEKLDIIISELKKISKKITK